VVLFLSCLLVLLVWILLVAFWLAEFLQDVVATLGG
jgi:hypothetical protein